MKALKICFVLLVITLTGCGAALTIDVMEELPGTKVQTVSLLSNGNYSMDILVRRALIKNGFKVKSYVSTPNVGGTHYAFNEAASRFVLRHGGLLSGNNPCMTNGRAKHFSEYNFELIDLRTNNTVLFITKGGWSDWCTGAPTFEPTDLFDDLSKELAKLLLPDSKVRSINASNDGSKIEEQSDTPDSRTKAQQEEFTIKFKDSKAKAEQGDASAQYNLGVVYHEGVGVLQDDKQAVKWWRKAAEQGYASAQYNLALMYAKGQGVLQNYKQAVKWFRKAAEQGHANGQYSLALMYENGKGVLQDYKQAVKWYRKATEQGNADAQHNLGIKYFKGLGVLQDYVMAHMYFNVAAVSGQKDAAKGREMVSKRMTPSQLAEAQKLAREWMRNH